MRRSRDFTIVISSINEESFVHVKSASTQTHNINSLDKVSNDELDNLVKNNIFDTPNLLKNKNIDEINQMIINLVAPNSESDISILNSYSEQQQEIQLDDTLLQLQIRNDFGLSDRKANQKLTKCQLNFIKYQINSSNKSLSELSCRFRVSPSCLSRIK